MKARPAVPWTWQRSCPTRRWAPRISRTSWRRCLGPLSGSALGKMSRGCTRPSSPSTRRSCHEGRRCSQRSRWRSSRRVKCPACALPPLASRRIDKEAWSFIGAEQDEYCQEDGPEWDEGRGGGPGPTDVQCLLYCHGGHEGAVWDRE